MNTVAEILWEAAADVEKRGVTRSPLFPSGETCAINAIAKAAKAASADNRGWALADAADAVLAAAVAAEGAVFVIDWNDAQPSRAVVAAAMRDAAFLAEWAGPHLLKAKP